MVCVPLTNGILFYNYVVRMRLVVKNEIQSQKENAIETVSRSHWKSNTVHLKSNNIGLKTLHIWENIIIGVLSGVTTLIALLFYALFPNSIISITIVYLDVILNGIFMLMALDIGQWLFCNCCKRFILNVST